MGWVFGIDRIQGVGTRNPIWFFGVMRATKDCLRKLVHSLISLTGVVVNFLASVVGRPSMHNRKAEFRGVLLRLWCSRPKFPVPEP